MRNKLVKGSWRGLLAAAAGAFLLAGCGWFSGGPAPGAPLRPGADRQIAPTGTLPPPPGHAEEQGIAPTDETRGASQVGSVVAAKGGQKAQREAAEKDAAERDAKAREERDAKEAAEREAKAKGQTAPSSAAPADAPPVAAPAPAEPATAEPKS